jgi:ornithine carbamoyltransferase
MYLNHRCLLAPEQLSSSDVRNVLDTADSLRRAARSGRSHPLLRGRNIGLMCPADDGHDALFFHHGAADLGAHVAHIRPSLSEQSTPAEVKYTARMLGRLYDAIECQGMALSVVRQVHQEAGIPVFDGIACRDHPVAALAELLGGDTPEDNRRFVLQAVLLRTIT